MDKIYTDNLNILFHFTQLSLFTVFLELLLKILKPICNSYPFLVLALFEWDMLIKRNLGPLIHKPESFSD